MAVVAGEVVAGARSFDLVVSGAADQGFAVLAALAEDAVVAGLAVEVVGAGAALDAVAVIAADV